MCGRFYVDFSIEDLIRQYKINKSEVESYSKGDIYPSQKTPIVINDNGKALKSAKWGFPLSGQGKLVINARSESIAEKSMFKNSFQNARCIIPASLFYEWKDEGSKKKLKHEIHLTGENITSLGGIFKLTTNDYGDTEISFVIVTTEANSYMKDIHPRMPLMIKTDALDDWLDNDTSSSIFKEIIKSNANHELKIKKDNENGAFEQIKLF